MNQEPTSLPHPGATTPFNATPNQTGIRVREQHRTGGDGDALTVRFWGVRGSIPSPGPDTITVGGNTSCVEITGGGQRLILDAGSGLRGLGDQLMQSDASTPIVLLLSHVHWDHVMGLPFFAPLYRPTTEMHVVSGPSGMPLSGVLRRQMSAPMFPVDFNELAADVRCREIGDGADFAVGPLRVRAALLDHPDPVLAYRIDYGGRSVVYATDTEHGGPAEDRLVSLCDRADVVIYDAQYLPEEYEGRVGPPRRGWGHSTYAAGIDIANRAAAKTLVLFHHDPGRSDSAVAGIVQRARKQKGDVVAAREGLSLVLDAAAYQEGVG